MFYGLFDPTFILVIVGLLLSAAASGYVNQTFNKYNQYRSQSGATGTTAAQFMLEQAGIHDVNVQPTAGNLTDNYNPGNKTLNLSEATYQSTSVAAIGVAAHECGHALQDHQGYWPMRVRSAIVPITNFGTSISFPIILVGALLVRSQFLINLGIWAFSLGLLFQLITLPVEFNASARALSILKAGGILTPAEAPMVRRVLIAAALTYVAAALATFLQLIRLVLLFGGRNDD